VPRALVTLGACATAIAHHIGPSVTVPHTRHVSVTASAIATLEGGARPRRLGIGTGGGSARTMGLKLEDVGRPASPRAWRRGSAG
jgi:hypothetical protein